jgi:ribosomal-protein-alanine N-acetyltransferase
MGRRVLLREPREDDADSLFAYSSDHDVTRFLAITPPASPSDTLYYIEKCREFRLQDREYVFVIARLQDDRALGVIGLRHLDPPMQTAEVGTWLGKPYWGTGANTEAKELLFGFAFGSLGLHRVEARIAVENGRSRQAFERLGGTREGLLRQSFFKDGAYLDQYLYVVLEPEWRGRHRGPVGRLRSAGKDGDND